MPCIQPMLVRSKSGYLVRVPCGKCYGCLRRKQRELALRLSLDVKHAFAARFITLTYEDTHLIRDYFNEETGEIFPLPSVTKDELQRFFKRLRKLLNYDSCVTKMMYYASAEYGDTTKRPHYHIILYFIGQDTLNYDLDKAIEKCWQKCDWNMVNREKCIQIIDTDGAYMYVAKHQMKKCQGTELQAPYFQLRSKGIGASFLQDEKQIDFAKKNGYIIYDRNKKAPLPRYFKEKLGIEVTDGELRAIHKENLDKENIEFEHAWKYYHQSHPNVLRETFVRKYFKKLIKDFKYSDEYSQIMYNKLKNSKL